MDASHIEETKVAVYDLIMTSETEESLNVRVNAVKTLIGHLSEDDKAWLRDAFKSKVEDLRNKGKPEDILTKEGMKALEKEVK